MFPLPPATLRAAQQKGASSGGALAPAQSLLARAGNPAAVAPAALPFSLPPPAPAPLPVVATALLGCAGCSARTPTASRSSAVRGGLQQLSAEQARRPLATPAHTARAALPAAASRAAIARAAYSAAQALSQRQPPRLRAALGAPAGAGSAAAPPAQRPKRSFFAPLPRPQEPRPSRCRQWRAARLCRCCQRRRCRAALMRHCRCHCAVHGLARNSPSWRSNPWPWRWPWRPPAAAQPRQTPWRATCVPPALPRPPCSPAAHPPPSAARLPAALVARRAAAQRGAAAAASGELCRWRRCWWVVSSRRG
jgi:hypothetical protein